MNSLEVVWNGGERRGSGPLPGASRRPPAAPPLSPRCPPPPPPSAKSQWRTGSGSHFQTRRGVPWGGAHRGRELDLQGLRASQQQLEKRSGSLTDMLEGILVQLDQSPAAAARREHLPIMTSTSSNKSSSDRVRGGARQMPLMLFFFFADETNAAWLRTVESAAPALSSSQRTSLGGAFHPGPDSAAALVTFDGRFFFRRTGAPESCKIP